MEWEITSRSARSEFLPFLTLLTGTSSTIEFRKGIHMDNETFNATAGFHLATAGTDRNVLLAEQIGGLEKNRIRVANEPEIVRLANMLGTLESERRQLQAALGATLKTSGVHGPWPMWQTIMAVLFVAAGFALTRMSLEPFDFNPELIWICSLGIACVCAYATSEFLAKTDLKAIVLGISVVLFLASLLGLMTLASVRGDIFLHHLQNLSNSGDSSAAPSTDTGLAFYTAVGPKMRMFLTLLSLALELAAGLALHAVRAALKARPLPPSPESRRLELVEREISHIEGQLRFFRNEPEIFEHEYRRNLYVGLLAGAARHARSNAKWPTVVLIAALGAGSILRGQAVDFWEGVDFSATSGAKGYDGSTADVENIESAARIIATLPSGSRITVAGISDESFSRPFILLTGIIPSDPGKLREYDQIAAARSRLSASVRRIGGSIDPRFQTTDILGFLMFAGMAFESAPHMRRVLVIHSDMRQSARPLDIEHVSVISAYNALRTVEEGHLIADLSAVEVYVYGVHALGKDIRYWQSLREFWAAYFVRCHATLRVFSMMRDVPNLASSR